jgi:hypothetical protein
MYPNSQKHGQIGSERQRDALARAEQYRRAQRLRASSRSAHDTAHDPAHDPEQTERRARRPMAWLIALTTRRRP